MRFIFKFRVTFLSGKLCVHSWCRFDGRAHGSLRVYSGAHIRRNCVNCVHKCKPENPGRNWRINLRMLSHLVDGCFWWMYILISTRIPLLRCMVRRAACPIVLFCTRLCCTQTFSDARRARFVGIVLCASVDYKTYLCPRR